MIIIDQQNVGAVTNSEFVLAGTSPGFASRQISQLRMCSFHALNASFAVFFASSYAICPRSLQRSRRLSMAMRSPIAAVLCASSRSDPRGQCKWSIGLFCCLSVDQNVVQVSS